MSASRPSRLSALFVVATRPEAIKTLPLPPGTSLAHELGSLDNKQDHE